VVLALVAVVVVLDQATKWWAWRHVSGVIINSGGDMLVGPTVGQWYANPVMGALLDVLDLGLVLVAGFILVRRRRPPLVLDSGTLVLAGWGSNLLDRLGMHYWTAPGSVRGAVDFIHIGHAYYNFADFFIVGATPVFLLAVAYLGWRAESAPATSGRVTQDGHPRSRVLARISAFFGAVGLIVVVALGAADYGSV
jgi:lipoprotein signal peptidase